jgi:hypothetical protein
MLHLRCHLETHDKLVRSPVLEIERSTSPRRSSKDPGDVLAESVLLGGRHGIR